MLWSVATRFWAVTRTRYASRAGWHRPLCCLSFMDANRSSMAPRVTRWDAWYAQRLLLRSERNGSPHRQYVSLQVWWDCPCLLGWGYDPSDCNTRLPHAKMGHIQPLCPNGLLHLSRPVQAPSLIRVELFPEWDVEPGSYIQNGFLQIGFNIYCNSLPRLWRVAITGSCT